MKFTTLGRTGLSVSQLCLGTMNFGPETSESDSFSIMDRALDHGINFFDTADMYGWQQGEGITEQIIGKWFAQGGNRRERVVIATKLYAQMGKDELKDWPNTGFVSALHIRRACEASLKRMQTDYIDLLQMHHIHRAAPWEEVWEAFEVLVRQGKVLYVGSSNFAAWHIVQANEAARRRNFLGLVSEQSKYSLLQRDIELEVGPACEAYGVGVIPWSPLAGGILAGVIRTSEGKRRYNDWVKHLVEEKREALTAWEDLCGDLGEKPADVALAWCLSRSFVTSPIIGPRTLEQLDGSLRALEIELSGETLEKIDAIFPPFKTAPEHYAW
ncbi:MAG: aldo/keto reductase [Fimbriimonadaceae bacterium]|jgi:aryl-alcohol dehydrogenase-like predicted oxidoreductase|nr:aldo/keto reductase [Fimbriimonadaceae bacterium]